jgi:hypothetical protein
MMINFIKLKSMGNKYLPNSANGMSFKNTFGIKKEEKFL